MNFFTLMTMLGGAGAVVSFLCGVAAKLRYGEIGYPGVIVWTTWHKVFEFAVGVTILSALSSI
jgi:hypothetical protein